MLMRGITIYRLHYFTECPSDCKNSNCDKSTGACFLCSDGSWSSDCSKSKYQILVSLNAICISFLGFGYETKCHNADTQ